MGLGLLPTDKWIDVFYNITRRGTLEIKTLLIKRLLNHKAIRAISQQSVSSHPCAWLIGSLFGRC